MPPDTVDHDDVDAAQAPSRLRYRAAVESTRLRRISDHQDGPCAGCRHFDRCTAETIICEAFALFARIGHGHNAERWKFAPRQPSAAILERLITAGGRISDAERRRAREALAVKLQREVGADY